MLSGNRRREGYWKLYDKSASREGRRFLEAATGLVEEAGSPWPKAKRGRPPVHSPVKLVVLCLLKVYLNCSFRQLEAFLPLLRLPWDEPTPDHSTIHDAMVRLPEGYLKGLLAKTAKLCAATAEWSNGVLAVDSTGVKTDRYEEAVIACRGTKRRRHLKLHLIAILDHHIILAAEVTGGHGGDSPAFRSMLEGLPSLEGCVVTGDKAYDADGNYELLYGRGLKPNISQRETGGRNRGRRFRRRAMVEYNPKLARLRLLVEEVFGAEAVRYGLAVHYRLEAAQRVWGLLTAVRHNLQVLNRLECARMLGLHLQPLLERL